MTRRSKLALAGGVAFALMAGTNGQAQAPDAALATQVAQLRAEVAQLRTQLAAMEGRAGLNGAEYRIGSPASRLVEIRGGTSSITVGRDGINIDAEKIRINGRNIALDGSRTIDLSGNVVTIDAKTVDVKSAQDTAIKGKVLREN